MSPSATRVGLNLLRPIRSGETCRSGARLLKPLGRAIEF
jgi:hypothetical protein